MKNAHKKSVEPFAFFGYLEVFDYLDYPIQRYKPTPLAGASLLLYWIVIIEVVEVPR